MPSKSLNERAEYDRGYVEGYRSGQKNFAEKVKAEIETNLSWEMFDEYGNETRLHKELMEILDNIGKEGDSK